LKLSRHLAYLADRSPSFDAQRFLRCVKKREKRRNEWEVNRSKMISTKSIVIAAVGLGLFSVPVFAQSDENQEMGGGMMKDHHHHHHAMMEEMHQKWDEQMKAEDAELDKLVQQMNTATGQKKMDAMAAVLNKMIEQRKAMHEKMENWQEKMGKWHRKWMEKKGMTSPAPGTKASPSPAAKSSPSPS
jgi:hypothetical protein